LELAPWALQIEPWSLGLGIWTLELEPWSLDLGPWTLDLGIWNLIFLMVTDFYAILGVSHDALPEDIRKAYHQLAKIYHPDVYKGAGGDKEFKLLNEAYRTLIHPEKRKRYDFKLKYGTLLNVKTQADRDRSRRVYIHEEMLRRDREQARRENQTLRKRFRLFDKFMFWSLLSLAIAGLVFGIIDLIINFRFGGLMVCIIITLVLIFTYRRSRNR
jgi:DnaJ-domain-containing protein 1